MISTFSLKQAIVALYCWATDIDFDVIEREILSEIRDTDKADEISLLYMELALLHEMKPTHTERIQCTMQDMSGLRLARLSTES